MCNNVLNKNDRGMRIEVVRMSKRSIVVRWNVLRSTLGSLRPQLHHQEHQRIATAAEQHDDRGIPPPVVLFFQVQCPEISGAVGVLADLAASSGGRIEQVRIGAHALLVLEEVLAAGLI
jgi:hypothetical protein